MRKKARASFAVAFTLLLLLLSLAWVASHRHPSGVAIWKLSHTYGLVSVRGNFCFVWLHSLERDSLESPTHWGGTLWTESWYHPDPWSSWWWEFPEAGEHWSWRTYDAATLLYSCYDSHLEAAGAAVYVGKIFVGSGVPYNCPALVIQVPYWMLFLIFTYCTLRAFYLWHPWHRPKPGHCLICGYDLRASQIRCPECGHPIPTPLPLTTSNQNKPLSPYSKNKLNPLLRRQRMLTRWVRRNVWWVLLTLVLITVILMQQHHLHQLSSASLALHNPRVILQPQILRPPFLGQPVTAECHEEKLNALLARWAQEANCNLRVDWKALENAGVDPITPITLHTTGKLPLEEALVMLCQAIDKENMDYDFVDGDAVIVTSTPELTASSQITVVYDVADLLLPAHVQDGELSERATKFEQLLLNSVDRYTWLERGGIIGTIDRLGDRYVIHTTRKTHRKLAFFLQQLRQAHGDSLAPQHH